MSDVNSVLKCKKFDLIVKNSFKMANNKLKIGMQVWLQVSIWNGGNMIPIVIIPSHGCHPT